MSVVVIDANIGVLTRTYFLTIMQKIHIQPKMNHNQHYSHHFLFPFVWQVDNVTINRFNIIYLYHMLFFFINNNKYKTCHEPNLMQHTKTIKKINKKYSKTYQTILIIV